MGESSQVNATLQPHQQRVVDELNEIKQRGEKLATFIGGEIFSALPVEEQRLLEAQSHIMTAYVEVLTQRIKHF
ncbi:crAss001_48 related protein [Serratia plymuthica]|uniref:crAss001_48 related protein n=1 Tax=Serratia plymuthica TaxID=82996 RepID=UPI003D344A58